jgi:hypothetical protein
MKIWTAVFFLVPFALQAQLNRSAVSVNGLDTNPCTPASPCRSFAQALTQTNARGEIVAVDSGGFGVVSVNKSLSIVAAPGVYAGISAPPGFSGVFVVANASDVVVVRGLTVMGAGATNAFELQSGARLYIENCIMENFGNAIRSSNGNLVVTDTILRQVFNGIEAYGGNSLVDHVAITEVSNIAIQAANTATVTVRNSVVKGTTPDYNNTAFAALNAGARMNVEDSAAFNTLTAAGVDNGTMRISNTAMTGNARGLWNIGGTIESFGNNKIRGNTTADIDGTVTPVGQD